ncbi:MAG: hypothetical protein AAF969_12720 [Bacteroidota bacterium]
MTTRILLFVLICLANWTVIHSQYVIKTSEELVGYQSIQQERIHVHINDSFFISGEYLYYKIYCLEAKRNKLSTISKIAYLELLGNDGAVVFKHKVKLDKGQGQGDFFIPVSIASGSYKLIAYTHWMLNAGQEAFFKTDIAVVNPYKELDKSLQWINKKQQIDSVSRAATIKAEHTEVKQVNNLSKESDDSLELGSEEESQHRITGNELPSANFSKERKAGHYHIVLPKKTFKQRELVEFELESEKQSVTGGFFSVSVRKVDSLPRFSRPKPTNMEFSIKIGTKNNKLGDTIFLPELRGELLSGNLIDENDSLLTDEKMIISLSKTYPTIKTTITDEKGKFFININEEDRNGEIELMVLGDSTASKRIVLDESSPINYHELNLDTLKVSSQMIKIISERSVHNQIESAYFHKRNDSVLIEKSKHKFLNELPEKYVLNDYKRFSSLSETIVEVIDNVWIKKEKNHYFIQIRGAESFFVNPNEVPLVFVDGFFVSDINSLLEYDVKKVISIAVSRDKYYVGPQIFHGILSISTSDKDFKPQETDFLRKQIPPPLPKKKYFFQRHNAEIPEAQKKYPDFRYQLFWEPELEITDKRKGVSFYTSDNPGNFEIIVQGYTFDGKPVSLSESFIVEK